MWVTFPVEATWLGEPPGLSPPSSSGPGPWRCSDGTHSGSGPGAQQDGGSREGCWGWGARTAPGAGTRRVGPAACAARCCRSGSIRLRPQQDVFWLRLCHFELGFQVGASVGRVLSSLTGGVGGCRHLTWSSTAEAPELPVPPAGQPMAGAGGWPGCGARGQTLLLAMPYSSPKSNLRGRGTSLDPLPVPTGPGASSRACLSTSPAICAQGRAWVRGPGWPAASPPSPLP